MKTFNWKSRIIEWSHKQIEQLKEEELANLPLEVIDKSYLCYPGATEEEIVAAETRLNVIPPAYRDFLKVTNGLRSIKV